MTPIVLEMTVTQTTSQGTAQSIAFGGGLALLVVPSHYDTPVFGRRYRITLEEIQEEAMP